MSYQFDHRLLADEMEIFFLNEEVGAGLPIWLPNGVALRDQIEAFMKKLELQHGYQRVISPHLGRESLYQRSGHLSCFQENMYPPILEDREKSGGEFLAPESSAGESIGASPDIHLRRKPSKYFLKPMNCPHHHKIFASAPRSYRQLPLRLAEYGQVYRYENSGSLKGLSRVRALCQNDGHIYVDPEEILPELIRVLELHEACYKKLGLNGYRYRLSLPDDENPQDFKGDARLWRKSIDLLKEALLRMKLPYFEAIGEAAFYGPKIDVQMRIGNDAEESIASIQLDFQSAEKFDLRYIAKDGSAQAPWIIHRAPLGSHERIIALLLEYYDGQLPGWLAPIQIDILPVTENELASAEQLANSLRAHDLRVHVDHSQGSLSKRIHSAHKRRPFSKLILGSKEIASGQLRLSLRDRDVFGNKEEILRELVKLCSG